MQYPYQIIKNFEQVCCSQNPKSNNSFFRDPVKTISSLALSKGSAMIMLKEVGVDPMPNYTREIKKGIARWDAYLHVPDPDAMAAEFSSRDVVFFQPLQDNDDSLRGFEVEDADGYILYFGCPKNI